MFDVNSINLDKTWPILPILDENADVQSTILNVKKFINNNKEILKKTENQKAIFKVIRNLEDLVTKKVEIWYLNNISISFDLDKHNSQLESAYNELYLVKSLETHILDAFNILINSQEIESLAGDNDMNSFINNTTVFYYLHRASLNNNKVLFRVCYNFLKNDIASFDKKLYEFILNNTDESVVILNAACIMQIDPFIQDFLTIIKQNDYDSSKIFRKTALTHLSYLYNKKEFSDVVLEFRDTVNDIQRSNSFFCNKSVLIHRSEYFSSVFEFIDETNLIDQTMYNSDKKITIPLKTFGFHPDLHGVILQWIYNGDVIKIIEDSDDLKTLADFMTLREKKSENFSCLIL